MSDVFYMIFVEGARGSTIKHKEFKDAMTEAARLAKKTGQKVFILKSIFVAETLSPPVTITRIRD